MAIEVKHTAYSSFEGVVTWSGGTQLLRQGQSIDLDHPLFRERPDLFQGQAPVEAEITSHPLPGRVEMNTQPPGGNRPTRAPRQGSIQ